MKIYQAIFILKKDNKEHTRTVFVEAENIKTAFSMIEKDQVCKSTLEMPNADLVNISKIENIYLISNPRK